MKVNEAKSLYEVLRYQAEDLIPEIHKIYLTRYDELCKAHDADPGEIFCKVRLARYLWGWYYVRCGDSIRAENEFLDALGTGAPAETVFLLPDVKIKYALMLLYQHENRIADLCPITQGLVRVIAGTEYGCGLNQKEAFSVFTVYNSLVSCDAGYLKLLRNMLLKIHRDVQRDVSFIAEFYEELLLFVYTGVLLLAETGAGSSREYEACRAILSRIQDNYSVADHRRILILRALVRIAPETGYSAEAYMDELVVLAESSQIDASAKAEVFQAAASFYCGAGQYDRGRTYLRKALNMIAQEWRYYCRYLDSRARQILESPQQHFLGCYDVLRRYMDVDLAYEAVLRFKALASLAGRERNRLLYSGRIRSDLLRDIQTLQDRIAWSNIAWIFGKQTLEYEEDGPRLRSLEAELAEEYPADVPLVNITLDGVKQMLPDQSAVVEYLFYEVEHEKNEFSSPTCKRETAIDIYVLCKRNHTCTLNRRTVPNGSDVLAKAQEFTSALSKLEESSPARIAQLKKELYQMLVKPILPDVRGVECLYLAPDRELFNLPFELLSEEKGAWVEELRNAVRIECGRDLLYCSEDAGWASGSLVMGNPQFAVHYGVPNPTPSLPFSGAEAELVSDYCGCECCSGMEASKNRLLTAGGCRNIHIATHGYFDSSGKTEYMYSSFLVFAGVDDWRHSGRMSAAFGNGIATADEISRMDLRGVELAVLSTCWGGMNQILEDKGFHGMLSAFSAAGVRYVVSNLWPANDLSTAILMGCFYFYYEKENLPPPEALSLAKQYLRNATVGQLEEDGWTAFLSQNAAAHKARGSIQNFRIPSDRRCPYADERFWGGFACYRCN